MKILLFHVAPTYHLGLHQHVHKASSTFGLLQMLLVREVPIRSSWLHFMRHIMLQFILHLVAAPCNKPTTSCRCHSKRIRIWRRNSKQHASLSVAYSKKKQSYKNPLILWTNVMRSVGEMNIYGCNVVLRSLQHEVYCNGNVTYFKWF